jgi:hypothetical protein
MDSASLSSGKENGMVVGAGGSEREEEIERALVLLLSVF